MAVQSSTVPSSGHSNQQAQTLSASQVASSVAHASRKQSSHELPGSPVLLPLSVVPSAAPLELVVFSPVSELVVGPGAPLELAALFESAVLLDVLVPLVLVDEPSVVVEGDESPHPASASANATAPNPPCRTIGAV